LNFQYTILQKKKEERKEKKVKDWEWGVGSNER
jgi:hypothetical protein